MAPDKSPLQCDTCGCCGHKLHCDAAVGALANRQDRTQPLRSTWKKSLQANHSPWLAGRMRLLLDHGAHYAGSDAWTRRSPCQTKCRTHESELVKLGNAEISVLQSSDVGVLSTPNQMRCTNQTMRLGTVQWVHEGNTVLIQLGRRTMPCKGERSRGAAGDALTIASS